MEEINSKRESVERWKKVTNMTEMPPLGVEVKIFTFNTLLKYNNKE